MALVRDNRTEIALLCVASEAPATDSEAKRLLEVVFALVITNGFSVNDWEPIRVIENAGRYTRDARHSTPVLDH